MGAEVRVNGKVVGKTPLAALSLPEGEHLIEMSIGDAQIARKIKVGERAPARYVWQGGDQWQSFY